MEGRAVFPRVSKKKKLPETNIGNWGSVPAYAYILTDTSSQFKVKGIPYQTSGTYDGSWATGGINPNI